MQSRSVEYISIEWLAWPRRDGSCVGGRGFSKALKDSRSVCLASSLALPSTRQLVKGKHTYALRSAHPALHLQGSWASAPRERLKRSEAEPARPFRVRVCLAASRPPADAYTHTLLTRQQQQHQHARQYDRRRGTPTYHDCFSLSAAAALRLGRRRQAADFTRQSQRSLVRLEQRQQ